MEESEETPLLLETVEDINEQWIVRLLNTREDHLGPRPLIHVKKWSRGDCLSKDTLAGFSSSRATIKVEYVVDSRDTQKPPYTTEETFVVKVIPTEGLMADLLMAEGMHQIEVGQYGRFLRTVNKWETERRGSGGIMAELVPSHALGISTDKHFTIVLPDLGYYGYKAMDIQTGLNEQQLLTAAEKMGSFHGTVVAFKNITGTDIQQAFPKCFNVGSEGSQAFAKFAITGFKQIKKYWSEDPAKAHLLKALQPYEEQLAVFVVKSLLPVEPFATCIHGDLQASNMFYKMTPNGQLTLKLIDWATSRYSQGTVDLIYLLNISVDTEVRRKMTSEAVEVYFNAFNRALTELGANLSYPRSIFDAQFTLANQLIVIWSIMCVNIFMTHPKLQERLDAILIDVLTNPNIKAPTLPDSSKANHYANDVNFC